MKNHAKRLLGLVPLLAMLLSLTVMSAFAEGHTATHDVTGEWSELTDNTLTASNYNLATGNYYLSGNVTNTESAVITISSGTVNLCLNSCVLNLNGGSIHVAEGATLNIYDCGSATHYFTESTSDFGSRSIWAWDSSEQSSDPHSVTGGCITGGRGFLQYGGAIYNKGTLTLNGGNIVGNQASLGGGVENAVGGSFTMNTGAAICGNAANNGGGMENKATFTMSGGSISGNDAAFSAGGVDNTSDDDGITFTMIGGSISGNHAVNTCGGVETVAGNTLIFGGSAQVKNNTTGEGKISNVTLHGATITIDTVNKPKSDMSVGVLSEAADSLTTNGTADDVNYFTSDSDNYIVKFNTDHLELASRITQQPTEANSYTVAVDTTGLSSQPTYQWKEVVAADLEKDDFDDDVWTAEQAEREALFKTEGTSFEAGAAYAPGTYFGLIMIPLSDKGMEADYYTFELNTELTGYTVVDVDDNVLTPGTDGTYRAPVGAVYTEWNRISHFSIGVRGSNGDLVTEGYTISNIRSVNFKTIAGETEAKLKNPQKMKRYVCTLTYADGSEDQTDDVVIPLKVPYPYSDFRTFYYNEKEQTFQWYYVFQGGLYDFNGIFYKVTNGTRTVDGTQTVTVVPGDNCVWPDGTRTPKTATFTINKSKMSPFIYGLKNNTRSDESTLYLTNYYGYGSYLYDADDSENLKVSTGYTPFLYGAPKGATATYYVVSSNGTKYKWDELDYLKLSPGKYDIYAEVTCTGYESYTTELNRGYTHFYVESPNTVMMLLKLNSGILYCNQIRYFAYADSALYSIVDGIENHGMYAACMYSVYPYFSLNLTFCKGGWLYNLARDMYPELCNNSDSVLSLAADSTDEILSAAKTSVLSKTPPLTSSAMNAALLTDSADEEEESPETETYEDSFTEEEFNELLAAFEITDKETYKDSTDEASEWAAILAMEEFETSKSDTNTKKLENKNNTDPIDYSSDRTVAFKYTADSGEVETTDVTCKMGRTVTSTEIPTPTRTGYVLDGWYYTTADLTPEQIAALEDGTSADAFAEMTKWDTENDIVLVDDVTLYAKWSIDTTGYYITFDANGGTGTMETEKFTITDGTAEKKALTANAFTAPEGKTFAGWITDKAHTAADYTDGQEITPTANMKLYALWSDARKPDPSVKVKKNNYIGVYDGKSHSATVTVTDPTSGASVTYAAQGSTKYTTETPAYKDAGTYTVNYKVVCSGYEDAAGTLTVTISPKPVTVSGITAGNKTYDGTTVATLNFDNVIFDGIVEGDTLTVTADGTFADAKVGENKTVSITNLTLGGESAANYQLAEDSQNKTTANITDTSDPVEEFVTRLYEVCLGRTPDTEGLNYWVSRLKNKEISGTQAAYGFVFSNEFKSCNYCNAHYLNRLYTAFMDRDTDEEGYNNWLNALNDGMTREEVFNGFAQSTEFANICASYGINVGEPIPVPKDGTVPTGACKACVTEFVTRLYTECLGREPDAEGLNYWCNALYAHTKTGASVAQGFIFSEEMNNRSLDDQEFVEMLYKALMGRGSDEEGLNNWVNALANGTSSEDVFNGFVGSQEFENLCSQYGIARV